MANIGILKVPHRFEALQQVVGRERLGEVLLESRVDLDVLKRAVAEVQSAGQGKLLFLLGEPGTGKTSLAESLRVFLADVVGEVVTPPPDYEVKLSDLPGWLAKNLPDARRRAGNRLVVLNLDGREVPASDANATRAAMVNLNAFLRRNQNILGLWPVVNEEFAKAAINDLAVAGAGSALAASPIHKVVGLDKSRFFDALTLIASTLGVKLADAAITEGEARSMAETSATVGQYLESVHGLVSRRYDIGAIGAELPKLSIVVASSAEDLADSCRMLRRGDQFLVDADRLLQYSRSNIADDWRQRGKENAKRSLAFVASLFEVRLINLSASAVVNACAFGPDATLKEVVRKDYPNPVSSNATNTIRNSALYRALNTERDVGPTGAGGASPGTRKAYAGIQKLSGERHRLINESVVNVLMDSLRMQLPDLSYEHCPFPDKGLRMDVRFKRTDRPETLEFTYRNEEASTAVIASYVLTKVQDYARDYQLI